MQNKTTESQLAAQVDPYPDGNMAIKQYKLDLAQWLATSKDCVVAYMDVKGTPGRGLAFHHWPYKDFSVSFLTYLTRSFLYPYLDSFR